jgi:hypothetical protein
VSVPVLYLFQTDLYHRVRAARARGARVIVVQGSTGCHEVGQGILMYDGTVKAVECVQAGDLLMGPDSQPRLVLRLHRGHGQMFKIQPTNGEPFVVNEDHILTLCRGVERGHGKGHVR